MKSMKKIVATLLAVILSISALSGLFVIEISADEAVSELPNISDYPTTVYRNPQEKLATMTKMLSRDGYELWIDKQSGEVATVETASGNILFSNPYDVASSTGSVSTKGQLLSQIVVNYTDNGMNKQLYSYADAACNDQINVQRIKNGVRVEYTIGREDGRKLVPIWIFDESYSKYIVEPMTAALNEGSVSQFQYDRFMNFWQTVDINKKSSAFQAQNILKYPALNDAYLYDENGLVYITEEDGSFYLNNRGEKVPQRRILHAFKTDQVSISDKNWAETMIKTYCSDYSYEQMDADHEETGYVATDEQYPVFKMALEYSLDKNGMSVRLPCNGLRYDMSSYTLESVSILPYMGAGNNKNAGFVYTAKDLEGNETIEETVGYNFYPDGSGSLFDFDQLNTTSTTIVRGKVYGLDYAYHEISGVTYQKSIRYPVYGTVSSEVYYEYSYMDTVDKETVLVTERVSNTVRTLEELKKELSDKTLTSGKLEDSIRVEQKGFLAMIESGDSLAEISTYHAGSLSSYSTMMNYFNPKPKDSYDISDSISVTSSKTMTIVSDRKYTGSLSLRYMMLCDKNVAAEARQTDPSYTYYDASWLGMAEAYRDYLCGNGTLSPLTEDEVENDIPLYIESFGALETIETVATMPVNVMTPLTTFEDLMTMYTELSERGIKNINFKMTGFANGGMYATVPYRLKWEKSVGGSDGFRDLVQKADAINARGDGSHLGLYPDFDFAYFTSTSLFDGLSMKKDAVRTIDNRYTSYRQYSATRQSYTSFYQLAISPSRYDKFYTKLLSNYEEYGLRTMSVASLGNALNSDFDEDAPYNREDSKDNTVKALKEITEKGYRLMADGGNAYTWAYMDHLLNVDLDSSRYIKSSASIPFVGAVLHGYIQFAGTPINKEGDTNYAILRALENGSGIYFILSYRNTDKLKEDIYLSQNYSVRYDIWLEDVVSYYSELNGLLRDVQTKAMIGHEFLTGERVLDLDELEADIAEKLKKAGLAEDQKQQELETAQLISVADAWGIAFNAEKTMKNILESMRIANNGATGSRDYINSYKNFFNANKDLSSEVSALLTAIKSGYETSTSGIELAAKRAELDAFLLAGGSKGETGDTPAEETEPAADEEVTDTPDDETQDHELTDDEREELKKALSEEDLAIATEMEAEIAALQSAVQTSYRDVANALTMKMASLREYTTKLMSYSSKMAAWLKEAQDLLVNLDKAIQLVEETPLYDNDPETRAKLLSAMEDYRALAATYMSSIQTQYNLNKSYLEEGGRNYALKIACDEIRKHFETRFAEGGAYAREYGAYQEIFTSICENFIFDEEDILNAIKTADDEDDNKDETVTDTDDRYVVNNNRIVAVTYGDRDAATGDRTAYKTFILNYNTYAVRVTYNNITYTIPSGGYVVVLYD